MRHTKIRLAYRIVIDHNAVLTWDKFVFEDTYREYLLQHQLFNPKQNQLPTFRELLAQNQEAEQLHYLVGIAANNYVQQLKGKLHRVTDVLGKNFLPFTNYELDIVNTDIFDRTKHKIGMTFYSPWLLLIDIVNDCYLVSEATEAHQDLQTTMFPVQPNLAICFVKNRD